MKVLSLAALLLTRTLLACEKENDAPAAGKGGSGQLRVTVNYRGIGIDSGRVRIKYNATAAPENNYLWDDSTDIQRLSNMTSQALFPNLKKGHYYLQATAYQPLSTPQHPMILKGGISYLLTDTGVVQVTLPVSEQ